ncbi:interphotoreceptor matrix proteoglycan 2 isoform X2 [Paramisgurnus dabryanus]|uniref:interphotoreceptor matrix proteoglycan 2 isoform X2 n=1 Tax=Paramisgurnus dabryanus TaxID=90735 RepID=UPI003CCF1003
MWQLIWMYSICFLACISVITPLDIATEEVVWNWFPTLQNSDKHSRNDEISRLFQMLSEKHGDRGLLPRKKRNVLLSSGVRLCSRETVQQVIRNHLNYFQLRVCQETVWEAFKIFWDRLPNQKEYQSWMSQCQDGTVTIQDIGSAFSQSKEHLALVQKRLYQTRLKSELSLTSLCSPEDSSQDPDSAPAAEANKVVTASVPDNVITQSVMEVTVETPSVVMTTELDAEITNEIEEPAPLSPRPLVEQNVELTLLLAGEPWSEQLSDPTSTERHNLTQQFTEKISTALKKLTEFKSVSVLDIRPKQDLISGEKSVLVEYVVFLQTSSEEISSETLDFINIQSNMVEGTYGDSPQPTIQYTMINPHSYITDALNEETSTEEANSATDPGHKADIQSIEKTPTLSGEVGKEVFTIHPTLGIEQEFMGKHEVITIDGEAPPITDDPNDIEDKGLVSLSTPSTPTINGVADDPFIDAKQDSDIKMADFDLFSGSGGTAEDWVTDLPTEAKKPSGKKEDGIDVLIDVDTSLLEEYEFTTITTITKVIEDHILPVEVSGLVTNEPGEDGDIQVGLDTPSTPRVKEEETKTNPESEVYHILPKEEESPEEDNKDVVVPTETQKGEESLVVITQQKSGEVDEKEGNYFVVASPTQFSKEDLTNDEILLVTVKPADPIYPTSLSPEKESPFTIITMMTPANVELTPTVNSGVMSTSLDYNGIHYEEEDGSGIPGVIKGDDISSIALPTNPGRALMVFFSLRVTNMMFSEDLFNKSSPEYKALEQRFIELLVPYLQSNLSNFENLEILNFRNGSIVVNSRMKFAKPVPQGVTTAVYLILEDFCNTAYQTMNLAIDKYSLDVESGENADPCKFQACNEYAECTVNRWSGEGECVCSAGYFSVDGLPCQSICELQLDFCLNDGKCDIIPDQGAICRCRVGENWWYRGEHCEEYVSEPLVVGIAIASVAGFLLVASGVIFFLARTLRDQYDKDELEEPIRDDSFPFLDRATKYNPMFESDLTTGYSHYYRRYPDPPVHSSGSAEASTEFSSEEIRHIYENSELTKEEIQDRIRILELYARDRQFADFVRQHQTAIDNQRESSSTQTAQLSATS